MSVSDTCVNIEKYDELIILRTDIDEVFRLCGTFRHG